VIDPKEESSVTVRIKVKRSKKKTELRKELKKNIRQENEKLIKRFDRENETLNRELADKRRLYCKPFQVPLLSDRCEVSWATN
jgi:hypothetical protein